MYLSHDLIAPTSISVRGPLGSLPSLIRLKSHFPWCLIVRQDLLKSTFLTSPNFFHVRIAFVRTMFVEEQIHQGVFHPTIANIINSPTCDIYKIKRQLKKNGAKQEERREVCKARDMGLKVDPPQI